MSNEPNDNMSLRADIREIRVELREVREHQEKQTVSIDELKQKVWSMQLCPHPGECLRIGARATEHESRIRLLEDDKNRAVGGLKVALTISGVLAALISTVVSLISQHLFK